MKLHSLHKRSSNYIICPKSWTEKENDFDLHPLTNVRVALSEVVHILYARTGTDREVDLYTISNEVITRDVLKCKFTCDEFTAITDGVDNDEVKCP